MYTTTTTTDNNTNQTAKFTALVSGKSVTILNKKSIAAYFHGAAKDPATEKVMATSTVFLVIDGVEGPLAVRETEDEVKTILGIQ